MIISKSDIIEKVRIALDEILPESAKEIDTFWEDQDTEIWQAVQIAAGQLSMELPRTLLEPKNAISEDMGIVANAVEDGDGEGYIQVGTEDQLPDYLALFELKMRTWKNSVTRTIEPGTAEAMEQANPWTCGTPWKPKVIEVKEGNGTKLFYWSVRTKATNTEHTVERLTYIPKPQVTTDGDSIDVGIMEAGLPYLIYRAGRLVLTAKKETDLARQFEELAIALKGEV